jgi:hypothetical protein
LKDEADCLYGKNYKARRGERYKMLGYIEMADYIEPDTFSELSARQSSQAAASIDGVRATRIPNRNSRIAASRVQGTSPEESIEEVI